MGSWDPKLSPKLVQRRLDGAATVWEGCLDGLEDSTLKTLKVPEALSMNTQRVVRDASSRALEVGAGEQYKYCILHAAKNLYIWEESGPMHHWPKSTAVHDFEAGKARQHKSRSHCNA